MQENHFVHFFTITDRYIDASIKSLSLWVLQIPRLRRQNILSPFPFSRLHNKSSDWTDIYKIMRHVVLVTGFCRLEQCWFRALFRYTAVPINCSANSVGIFSYGLDIDRTTKQVSRSVYTAQMFIHLYIHTMYTLYNRCMNYSVCRHYIHVIDI